MACVQLQLNHGSARAVTAFILSIWNTVTTGRRTSRSRTECSSLGPCSPLAIDAYAHLCGRSASAAGSDILLLTPPSSNVSLIEYRLLGGTLDFYFLSGPSPTDVIEQYGALIGLPTWQPYWGFGFQLCRWGYTNVSETRDQVQRMRDANIPLEVMWNDIDLYHAYRDFTTDPVSFPAEEVRAFIRDLVSRGVIIS